MAQKFHLGWFLQGSSVQAWSETWTGNIGTDWMYPRFFIEMAQNLERACFDYILLEDSSYVGESFGGSRDIYLKNGLSVPRQDPAVIAGMLLAATKHIGICPTLSTFAYPPYLLARLVATLDQVSGGRAGWNMVTGSSDFAAQNLGLPKLPEHDERYEMADEYMHVVQALWNSWEPGAIVADTETGMLVDPDKVHAVNYQGKYYSTRGPLNSGPPIQQRPVIAQAGGSARGKQFAALHADTIVASVKGVGAMKAYRDDVRARAVAQGRNPDDIKVLFLVMPILGETDEDAQRRKQRRSEIAESKIEQRLAHFGKTMTIDFGKMDLDAPIPDDVSTNGHQQNLAEFRRIANGRTIRETMRAWNATAGSVELVGSPDTIAGQMEEAMQEAGGDGFLFSMPDVQRRTIAEVCDGLVPALQKRGLMRTGYDFPTFGENLRAF